MARPDAYGIGGGRLVCLEEVMTTTRLSNDERELLFTTVSDIAVVDTTYKALSEWWESEERRKRKKQNQHTQHSHE